MRNMVCGAFCLFAFGLTLTSETTEAGKWNTGGSGSTSVVPQTDPGGPAVNHTRGAELPQSIRPNDNTISLYQDKRIEFIRKRYYQGRIYFVKPIGNASDFKFVHNVESKVLDQELSKYIREHELEGVPHGFRSTLRTWLTDHTDISYEIAEMIIAHQVGSQVECAYNRTDYLEQRRH